MIYKRLIQVRLTIQNVHILHDFLVLVFLLYVLYPGYLYSYMTKHARSIYFLNVVAKLGRESRDL